MIMTPAPVTDKLLHHLVASSHAHGITELAVAAALNHDARTLLIVESGLDFIDDAWQLPTERVLPGETLTDALAKILAAIGLDIDEVTGYLGHHDEVTDTDIDAEVVCARVFCFAVTVTRPERICQSALIGHWWADPWELPDLPEPLYSAASASAATHTPARRAEHDPPLAKALRTHARGLCAAQAGTELLIDHATWLHRSDFADRFVHLDITITGNAATATIDWPAAITALDTGELPCSSSEERMLRLAASLIQGIPVDLRDALTSLDSRNLNLVSQAVLHTADR